MFNKYEIENLRYENKCLTERVEQLSNHVSKMFEIYGNNARASENRVDKLYDHFHLKEGLVDYQSKPISFPKNTE